MTNFLNDRAKGEGAWYGAPLPESMIVIQKLTLDSLMPSVDFLKIEGASASVNEKLKAAMGTVKLAASTHTTANNYFKNVEWFSKMVFTQSHV